MAKSIIGFYSEPLSQVERDEVFAIIAPLNANLNTRQFIHYLDSTIKKIVSEHSGGKVTSRETTSFILTHKLISILTEAFMRSPTLDYIKHAVTWETLKTARLDLSESSNDVVLSGNDTFNDIITEVKLIPAKAESIGPYAIDQCNRYLSENPEERVFEKTEKALKVDRLNNELLKMLALHGYRSELSRPIYDFSPTILKNL